MPVFTPPRIVEATQSEEECFAPRQRCTSRPRPAWGCEALFLGISVFFVVFREFVLVFFPFFFEVGFGKVFSRTFIIFGTLWGSQGTSFFVCFSKKVPLFLKRWDPRFCTPLQHFTSFWLDFARSGTSCRCQKPRKTASKLSSFFDVETKAPKPFFIILNMFLGSFWGAFWSTFGVFWLTFGSFLLLFVGSVSGNAPGPLLASFWLDFAPIL